MSEVIIIESSCLEDNKESNSSWETFLPKPIIVENGDMINMKSAYINQESLTGSNILLDVDTKLVFEFGFYIINGIQFCATGNAINECQYYFLPTYCTNPASAPNTPVGPGPAQDINMNTLAQQDVITDFEPYVFHAYDSVNNTFELITDRFEMEIKAGSYTPQEIQTIITDRLSSINGQVLQGDRRGNQIEFTQLFSGSRFLLNATSFNYGATSYWLDSYTSTTNMDTVRKFRMVPQTAGNAPLAPANTNVPTYFIGTNQMALDYDDISQTFQWSFIHMPMVDPSDGQIANALTRMTFKYNNNVDYYVGPIHSQTKQGGIFFTKLEPVSFWEQLGFNLNNVVVDTSNGIDITEVMKKTSDQQLGLTTILSLSPLNNMVVNQGWEGNQVPLFILKYLQNNNIVPLKAESTYQSSNSGYYLISTELGFNNEYNDGNKIYGNISAIASKQWIQNDFVSVFDDGGIPYIHSGSPFLLSSVKVKILNSQKNLAENLKPNSTLFIQIIKGNQQEEMIPSKKQPSNPANR
jgi:hypothetical protein